MSSSNTEVEEAKANEHLQGFADFSQFISSDDDLSVYRRFGGLGARNILYLQAELQFLERQLADLDAADLNLIQRQGGDKGEQKLTDDAARSWESFIYQVEEGNERQKDKMRLVLRIREVMKEYEETVLRRSQILSLDPPSGATRKAFMNWFFSRMPFRGTGWHLLEDEGDLMALKKEQDVDRLSTFIQHYFGYYLKAPKEDLPKSWEGVYYFPAKRMVWVVAGLSILISALLLLGAILSLYYIPATFMGRRLAVIGVFTVAFAASVGMLTNAKRGEIFATTAAYAAVLVVFLSAPTP